MFSDHQNIVDLLAKNGAWYGEKWREITVNQLTD